MSTAPSSRPRIPLLRFGAPYRSLDVAPLSDLRDGSPVAEVSQANPGLVARDLARGRASRAAAGQAALGALTTAELLAIARRAATLLAEGELPLGEGSQTPEQYVAQVSATTGLPRALARRNLEKVRSGLAEMEGIFAGLTRGLDPAILDRGFGAVSGRGVSYRRETDVLGAILPSNSPGVHTLWLPALVLKVALALKPGRQEPWTPYRVAQAYIAAGCPAEAWGFYPTSYAGAGEILLGAGRSLLFGDQSTVGPWRGDPRIEVHGPGWSKVVLGADRAPAWEEHLDLLAASVADNGGRSCINASGIWTPSHGRELAQGLARRLAEIPALPLDHPQARLAAFPSREAAHRLSAHIDRQLAAGGAEDLTAPLRAGGRVAEADGCAFLLPTVLWCEDPEHPLAQAEYLFPFVSVVEVPQAEMLARLGPSLVVTALTDDAAWRRELLGAGQIDRLNLGPIPTTRISWDQPHEGNLFDLLYRRRSLQAAEAA